MEKIELENITEDSERDIEQEKNNLLRVMEQLRKCRLKTLVMCVLMLVVAFIILRLFVPSLSGTANGIVKFMLVVICIIDCIYYFIMSEESKLNMPFAVRYIWRNMF